MQLHSGRKIPGTSTKLPSIKFSILPGMKHCSRCKTDLPLTEFRKVHGWCKTCQNEYNRQWYMKNRERGLRWRKNGHLKRTFGITLEEYEDMLEKQDRKCAICESTSGGNSQYGEKKLAVDHDHDTGKVRGLLCENCNRSLGMMRDSVELLGKAIVYLKER